MMLPTHTFEQSPRDATASCASDVRVITTDGAAGRYGITMTAAASATDEPPTMILYVNREAGIIPILLANRGLYISTLSHRQQDTAEHFTGMTNLSPEERFTYYTWNRGQNGQLEVRGALTQLYGGIITQKEMGIHFVFFTQVNETRTLSACSPVLLYFRRLLRLLD